MALGTPDHSKRPAQGGRTERKFEVTLTLDEIKATLRALDYFAQPQSKRYPYWTAGQKIDEAAARAHLVGSASPREQCDTGIDTNAQEGS